MVNLLLVLVFSCIVLVSGGFVILCALSCFCFALVFVGGGIASVGGGGVFLI